MAIGGVESSLFAGSFSTLSIQLSLPPAGMVDRPGAFDILLNRRGALSTSANAFTLASSGNGSENASGLPTRLRLVTAQVRVTVGSGLSAGVIAAQSSDGPELVGQTLTLFSSTANLTAGPSSGTLFDIRA